MKATRILLVDDHALLRAGMRALLETVPGATIVAEASEGGEAIDKIAAFSPDLVLMDIAMPGLDGLKALERIIKEFPPVRVLILTMHANEEYVLQALRCGAAGYLLKNATSSELQLALETVVSGEIYISPSVARTVAEYLQRVGISEDSISNLTPRQREVLKLIAESSSTKEIAATLNISAKTVEMHRRQLMERLGINDIAGLVRYAIQTGLIDSRFDSNQTHSSNPGSR